MKKQAKAGFLAVIAVLSGAVGAVGISGCGGGGSSRSSTRRAPDQLFGTWRLVSIGGGITGQGQPVTEEVIITFTRDGRTFAGRVAPPNGGGRYQVVRTSSFFGGNLPVLEYLPVGSQVNLVIFEANATRLGLGEEAADGFGYTYERVP